MTALSAWTLSFERDLVAAKGDLGLDAAEFEEVYRTHFPFVRRLVARLGVLPSDTQDVAHDVFVAIASSRGPSNPDVPYRAWIAGVARNVVREHRRGTFRWIRNLFGWSESRPSECDGTAPENARAVTEVREMLAAIPEDQRVVFVLVHFEDWTVPEIASGLEIPLPTAYSRLRAARIAFERQVEGRRSGKRRSS